MKSTAATIPTGAPNTGRGASILLQARPEPLQFEPQASAVIVVDMQNAYASAGGYLDLAGFDISGAQAVAEQIKRVTEAARQASMPVFFLQNGWDAAYVEAGGPGSPNWHKSNAMKTMRARPELQGRLLARGGWDYRLIDGLQPQAGDIVVAKPRYSGMFHSPLDSMLRARGIRTLVFTGVATNVCVESTLRDAFHLEYFSVMLEDATYQAGPSFIQQATAYNVETFFGWVSTANAFCASLTVDSAASATPDAMESGL